MILEDCPREQRRVLQADMCEGEMWNLRQRFEAYYVAAIRLKETMVCQVWVPRLIVVLLNMFARLLIARMCTAWFVLYARKQRLALQAPTAT